MNAWIKYAVTAVVLLLVFSPFLFYIGITVTNDCIADRVKKDLLACPLPEQTVLVESVSAAGKLVGNGNGMQYMGAILVTSDLTKDELLTHYKKEFDHVEVERQLSSDIPTIRPNSCRFDKFDTASDEQYYAVILWGSKDDFISNIFSLFLNFDLRGH